MNIFIALLLSLFPSFEAENEFAAFAAAPFCLAEAEAIADIEDQDIINLMYLLM